MPVEARRRARRTLLASLSLIAAALAPRPSAAQPSPSALAPDERGASGLRADLDRILGAEEGAGWFLDAQNYTSMHATVMQSVCRASPEARALALARLEDELRQAGDPRELYEQAGRVMTDEARRALSLEHEARALRIAIEAAPTTCPFWVEPARGFDGRQTDRNRWTLSLETGGLLQLRKTDGSWTYGGGGGGRLLLGYGFGGKITLMAGPELAGGAMLQPHTEPSEFVINYLPAFPLVLRVHDGSWHYDLEAAPVAIFQADNTRVSYGARGGFSVGVAALKTRFFIPWAGAAFAVEHYFAGGGRSTQEFIRAGLRVGAVWDP